MALQIRLMKLKGKALGDNKIPITDRIFFSVHPPTKNDQVIPAVSLFTNKSWSVGRSIDLFASRLKIENNNDKVKSLKLHLFKLNNGEHISSDMNNLFSHLISNEIVNNGDSLILYYVDATKSIKIEPDKLVEYQLSSV